MVTIGVSCRFMLIYRLLKRFIRQLRSRLNSTLRCHAIERGSAFRKANKASELTVEELFRDYQGKPVNTTPTLFENTGYERW